MNKSPQALSELFTQYVKNQAAAREEGLGYAETLGDVTPHDTTPVQPVDPALAWKDAVAAASGSNRTWGVPTDWPQLVATQEPAVALAFALGNFPQLVRNLQPLLTRGDLTKLREAINRPPSQPALLDWAASVTDYPQKLLAAGVLRLARHFDRAGELLRVDVPAEWRALRPTKRRRCCGTAVGTKTRPRRGRQWQRRRRCCSIAAWRHCSSAVPLTLTKR